MIEAPPITAALRVALLLLRCESSRSRRVTSGASPTVSSCASHQPSTTPSCGSRNRLADAAPGPAQGLTEIGAAISFQSWSSPLPAGFTQRYALTIDGLSADTLVEPSCEFWISYVR